MRERRPAPPSHESRQPAPRLTVYPMSLSEVGAASADDYEASDWHKL